MQERNEMAFTLGMILEARERLKGVAQRTGLVQFKALSDEHSQIYLKTEDLQNTGSFKVRGAYIKIASLSEEERACGVIASSAGNHAQGVAFSSARDNDGGCKGACDRIPRHQQSPGTVARLQQPATARWIPTSTLKVS